MFWLSRPPYVRWTAAALILAIGLFLELRPTPTVSHPFALDPIGVGEMVDTDRVRWVEVPAGLLPPVDLPVVADRAIAAGDPILSGGGEPDTGVPDGWWAIEVDLPAGARPGMAVRLVTPETATEGVIVETSQGDFGEYTGLVAVPSDMADRVAAAVMDASIVVMVGG